MPASNGVADTSPTNLMNCLSECGVLVSDGGMTRKPMAVQPGSLIFKKQTIRGFWLVYRYQSAKLDEITAMFDHLAPLITACTISIPVARPLATPSSSTTMEAATVKTTTMKTTEVASTGKMGHRSVIEAVRVTEPMVLPRMMHPEAGLATVNTAPVRRITVRWVSVTIVIRWTTRAHGNSEQEQE